MKAIIQRVRKSFVTVEGKLISSIDEGLLILLGVADNDNSKDVDYLVDKITNLRIFEDEN